LKTLIIIRHSKSSWKDHSLSDFDRPLNKRGKKDAKKMSFELSEKIRKVDLLLSSSSKRTTQTSNYFLDSIDVRSNIFSENLYHSSSDLIFDFVLKINNKYNKTIIVGHNPGLTNIVNKLTNLKLDNLPTSGIVIIVFDVDNWKKINYKSGLVEWIKFPKDLKL
jgi:phosphohistidine phosphatase